MTTATLDRKTTPAAWADEEKRHAVAGVLAVLGERGWTRPAILAALDSLGTPMVDSAVYRAQRAGAHIREIETWEAFFAAVDEGRVSPPEKARKLSAKAVVERAEQAAAVLAALGEKPNQAAMREALAKIAELLPPPKADEPEATEGDEPEASEDEAKDEA